ncbi:hypothetical protein Pan153_17820 [Gimesia panareensis]|uniref:Uncharacterized protein n=1 Tax=Gimesia panareensis TaxID=2527978 RepID=A0A518FLI3_9PLAN|nr:hypothetical protein [Gimesia panareensis]QDV17147.1 hypothetical protein Pan153_17820 [Gimesia panareensis]
MNDMTKGLQSVETYFSELEQIDWFSQVGCEYQQACIRLVNDWEDAYKWTIQPITEWCDLEAKQRIYRHMSSSHYDEFAKWNEAARLILPKVEKLVDIVRQYFPEDAPGTAVDWFQCQLIGASMELFYADFIDSSLFRDQLAIYKDGHFPCGWHVESEDMFPEKCVVVVF